MNGVWRLPAVVRAAVVFFAASLAGVALGDNKPPAPVAPAAAAPPQPALDPKDIEAFLDGLVPLQIETNDIAGATISIVKDGKVVFAKGYGYADVKTKKPVSAETTLFRVGSITKLATWTSVMQLVEQGKIDLDADVNTYLDFQIPKPFGKPVTMRNLMTHRAGFQEILKNLGAQNAGKPDMGKYVRENLPAQIFEPGTTPSYSNYGTALAGYIVERVSGKQFDAYVEDNIFKPLGMTHSTLRQPLPKNLEADMSSGYRLASGEPLAFEIVNGYACGSQSSSAIDMTKFMIAFLNGGALGEARILKPETVALMHNTVTTLDNRQNGIGLGFYEAARGSLRTVGHGGDTIAFHSDMHLIPSQSFGFFVSYNSAGRSDVPPRSPLWRKFRERYFVDDADKAVVAKDDTTKIVGSYVTTRRSEASIFKIFAVLGQATVTADADGVIQVDLFTGLNGQPRRWEPLGEGEYRAADGRARLIFKPDAKGRMMMLPSSSGIAYFQKVDVPESSALITPLLFGSMAVLALNLVLWPAAAGVRRHYGINLHWNAVEHILRLFVMMTSLALLTLFIGFAVTLAPGIGEIWRLDDSADPTLRILQLIGYGGVLGSFFAVVNAIQAWANPMRGFWGRLKESVVALACLALIWIAWTMNLFDQTLRY
ncbi:MAG: beta-lactamase family protein [Alphaproteobacteria bacterium]|nr:beta-lactamase family protein [Alphaproteobacteria bacterium]